MLNLKELGSNIRKARKAKKLTQAQLAEKIGITASSVTQYEGGKIRPEIEKIEAIAEVLNVTVQDLFDPSQRERIAKEEIKKAPFRYLDEIEGAQMLRHAVVAEVMSVKAAAGEGNHIESVDLFTTGRKAVIDTVIFKTPPKGPVRLMQVDGNSMAPMLYPDSWVLYEDAHDYTVDGLYVINYNNELMVKLLQFNPEERKLEIISKNPDYKSYKIDPGDQSVFRIVGKVLRCII